MNSMNLLRAIGKIDEKYINEAEKIELHKENRQKTKKFFKFGYIIAPICAVFIAVVGVNYNNIVQQNINENAEKGKWIVKEVYIGKETTPELAIAKKWDEMTISQQFSELYYDDESKNKSNSIREDELRDVINTQNKNYLSRNTIISNSYIESLLGTSSLTGYDSYKNILHNTIGYTYKIKGISDRYAVAVKFENDNNYYVYVNSYYKPNTLEEFVDDLNLKENISFGTVYYEHWYNDEDNNKQYENIQFEDVEKNVIWDMLFSNLDVINMHKDTDFHKTIMSISVDIELLGYKNISVAVTEDGYLTTNILDIGKAFYIGTEKVNEFVNYILEHYQGYKIVYITEDENIINESITNEEIITMENTTKEN